MSDDNRSVCSRPDEVPPASSEAALHRMKATRQRNTRAESALQQALEALGLTFETDVRLLQGSTRRADIVFTQERVAVFADGCFWHGCPIHGTWPKRNAAFWQHKIETNKLRDADTDARLAEAGWTVIRVWEHEDPTEAAEGIARVIRQPE